MTRLRIVEIVPWPVRSGVSFWGEFPFVQARTDEGRPGAAGRPPPAEAGRRPLAEAGRRHDAARRERRQGEPVPMFGNISAPE